MRTIMLLFVALTIALLPCKGFAQTPSGNRPTAMQQSEKCRKGKIHIRVKLNTGEKLEGGLLDKTPDTVKVCHNGATRTFAATDIEELQTRMTGKQKFRHTLRVLGVAWAVLFIVSLALYGGRRN